VDLASSDVFAAFTIASIDSDRARSSPFRLGRSGANRFAPSWIRRVDFLGFWGCRAESS
jgi:hypothetical protein